MAKGFKSSTVTFKAEMTEQQRVVDGINAKMFDYEGVKRKVSEYRETRKGKPLHEAPPNHDDVRESWREIVAVMQECRRPYPTSAPAPVVKPPVVFVEFVQVVEDMEPANPVAYHNPADSGGTISELVAKLSPLPERVVVLDVEPLLLPSVSATTFARRQRKVQQITRQFAKMPTVQLASGDVIQLPAYFGSDSGNYLAEARAKYQAKMDAGENVSGGVEHKPSYQGAYSGSMHSWSRR